MFGDDDGIEAFSLAASIMSGGSEGDSPEYIECTCISTLKTCLLAIIHLLSRYARHESTVLCALSCEFHVSQHSL